jgi:light-regulated signal transduction histidine kinase (bacteriophytochrome)
LGRASAGEHLEFIVEGADRIELLIDGLVGYSIALQIDPAGFLQTDMNSNVRTALRRLEKEVQSSGASVTFAPLPRVAGDPDRLIQLVENLVRNALQNRGDVAPQVHIDVESQADKWLFSVDDNGPGVEALYLEKVFQPFERLHGKHRPGLGLAVCRAIVERHGGRIWAEFREGAGGRFRFTLPVGPAD